MTKRSPFCSLSLALLLVLLGTASAGAQDLAPGLNLELAPALASKACAGAPSAALDRQDRQDQRSLLDAVPKEVLEQAAKGGGLIEVEIGAGGQHLLREKVRLPQTSVFEKSGWCGDGTCSSSNPYENCSSCPEDCCGCPTELEPISRLRLVETYTYNAPLCYEDVLNTANLVVYYYTRYQWRIRTFTQVLECNGTITETMTSESFYYTYCLVRTSTSCPYNMGFPPGCYSI